jgi:5'-nucleotidase
VRILVTNDDGIEAEGLHVLVDHLLQDGHEVLVVAPDQDWSGASSSLGRLNADEHLDARRVEIPTCPDAEAWSLAGPPGLCVLATALEAFGPPPEVIVSGINAGLNTGRAILHSGTVGAVLTGQNFGLSGLAVSVQATEPWRWDTAARLAVQTVPLVVGAPARTALNLNVPAVGHDEVRGVRWARLAPFGEVRAAVAEIRDGSIQFELVAADAELPADSDEGLVRAGWAALTTLVGIAEAWPADEGLDGPTDVAIEDHIAPGAPLHHVHRVPDASAPRTLRRPRLGT